VRFLLRRGEINSTRKGEEGVVVLLVAMFLLFVVGAMAALAVDLVTFYTARSEAQQAADGAALAGARVLANSGMTSADPTDTLLTSSAKDLASTVATQVATENKVGGAVPTISVTFNVLDPAFHSNPHVTVQVSRTDLPVFFSRIWGNTAATVKASATAEAYNPSGDNVLGQTATRIAPACVKPWVLPNMTSPTTKIFNENTGDIQDFSLLGQPVDGGLGGLSLTCSGNCGATQPGQAWRFFPGNQTSFPAPPPQALQACGLVLGAYQQSISGCVRMPVTCGNNSGGINTSVDLDTASVATGPDTQLAVDCLTHAVNNFGDKVDPAVTTGQPLQYIGGNDNPIAGAQGAHVMVSDSIVTVPVVDVSPGTNFPAGPVQVLGFVQFFLNPTGSATPPDHVPAKIINMTGCGKNATGQPIQGNGASSVMVRLVAP
jgi:hypothetical protein